MKLLQKFSPDTAHRMEEMNNKEVIKYNANLSNHERNLTQMQNDLLGLSKLCMVNFESRKNRQLKMRQSSQSSKQRHTIQTLSIEERSAILERTIVGYQKSGYQLVSRTETTAQLFRKKQFSCCIAIILVVLVIGPLLYLIYYLIKNDDTVFIEVDEYGRVRTTRT